MDCLSVRTVAYPDHHETGKDHECCGQAGVVALVLSSHPASQSGQAEHGEGGWQADSEGSGFSEERADGNQPGIKREDGAGATLEMKVRRQEVVILDNVSCHSGHDCLIAGAHLHEGEYGQKKQPPEEDQWQVMLENVTRILHTKPGYVRCP